MFPQPEAFSGEQHRPFTLEGNRGVAVLVHGFPGTADDLRPLAEELHAHEWAVEAMLLPGFGPELASLANKTALEWTTAITDRVDQLRRRHCRVVIVGHSLGGALAITVSATRSLDGLLLLAPFFKVHHPLWQMLPVLQYVLPQVKPYRLFPPNFDDPKFREDMARMVPGIDLDREDHRAAVLDYALPVKLLAQVRLAGVDAYAKAPKVRARTLVIQGVDDKLVVPDSSRKLAMRLGGTVQYLEIPGGHDLHARDEPSWPYVRDAVLQFLTTLDVERASE